MLISGVWYGRNSHRLTLKSCPQQPRSNQTYSCKFWGQNLSPDSCFSFANCSAWWCNASSIVGRLRSNNFHFQLPPSSSFHQNSLSPLLLLLLLLLLLHPSVRRLSMTTGLMSAHITNPVHRPPNRLLPQSPLLPELAHCATLKNKLYGRPLRLTTQFSTFASQSMDSSSSLHNTSPSKEVLEIWRNADAVCFDVDSTVCLDEGIDELAEFCGAGKAVAEWTARAMGGSVPFEEALAARLSLFNPSLSQVQQYLEKQPPRISPGIDELITKLKSNNTDVYLVSGGFRQMIQPVALLLGIPVENIYANQLLFGSSGEFVGFDKNEPTSRSGGKPTAVQQLRKAHDYKKMVMIGDGATDLEARKPGGADLFICYAGVQLREAVAAKADWLVFNFKDLISSLE